MDQTQFNKATVSILKDMENTAAQMRDMIVSMPPLELLGYIYGQRFINAMNDYTGSSTSGSITEPDQRINESQLLLEYVHAVLSSTAPPTQCRFDESKCVELLKLARILIDKSMSFSMISSVTKQGGAFGPATGDIEFHAKTAWVMIRGHRYQVLEGEFYNYVLSPHDDVLNEVYGVSAADIAVGFQSMSDAFRSGHADAMQILEGAFKAATESTLAQRKSLKQVLDGWGATGSAYLTNTQRALEDVFMGGIANVSRHTNLPQLLLSDLAYERGQETEFFADGKFAGTPFRTLPVRKKPLIKIGLDYFAVDPCFARDAGYRVILHNLLRRRPSYKKAFEQRQKSMSEAAFADILSNQLLGAKVYQEVYYKDPATNKWCENDTIILMDGVLFLVEAKAGAAATIASPALDFERHIQSVNDLVLKAYKQCERFFNYINSSEEVPLYQLKDGTYTECGRLCSANYRVKIPIGLTIESFSPFSAYCKELPQVEPLLGKYAFVSMSIDDIFVLNRILQTAGELIHYLEVRQAVAGIRGSRLYDEMDHLGAYVHKNRFDMVIAEQLRDTTSGLVIWDRMSDIIDQCFETEDWAGKQFPTQKMPKLVRRILETLNSTRSPGWTAAESLIRDLSCESKDVLARMLSDHTKRLAKHPSRHFGMSIGSRLLFVWLQIGQNINFAELKEKAIKCALKTGKDDVICIALTLTTDGRYHKAEFVPVDAHTDQPDKHSSVMPH